MRFQSLECSVAVSPMPVARSASGRARDHRWHWTISALRSGPKTFHELREATGRFTPEGPLLSTLIDLERTRIVRRDAPRPQSSDICYALTNLGEELALLISYAQRTAAEAEAEACRSRSDTLVTRDLDTSSGIFAYRGYRGY